MIDTLSEVWGNIKRNKLRTIATGFAVSSGLFLVITLQGAGNGLIHTMDKSVEGMALDVTRVYPSYTSKSFDG
ncbi:MAG: ABC transporter permease, partial [Bacteroidaceae bacterium]|nr:ABC transporter permease [Bacteroidaceae bacterium]